MANAHTNAVELKSIFNLFDQNNSGEIEIKQINQFLKSIESLRQSSLQEKKKPLKTSESNENFSINDADLPRNNENFSAEKDTLTNFLNNELEDNEKAESSAVELKVFPNKKTAINFNEFSNIFNEALAAKDLQEELLLSCFSVFDYNRFY